jgi:hypothetical protein
MGFEFAAPSRNAARFRRRNMSLDRSKKVRSFLIDDSTGDGICFEE